MGNVSDPIGSDETTPGAPDLPANQVVRQRLIDRLQSGLDHHLTLISAPPGYGKTVMAATWLRSCGQPAAWLALTERDRELEVFLRRCVAAVRQIFPGALALVDAFLHAPELPSAPVLAGSLINDLESLPRRFILALDDYHLGGSPELDDLWAEVLRHPPHALHLLVCTQRDPSLPLADFRARGRITEIRTQDLAFTPAELALYLVTDAGRPLSADAFAPLLSRSEGWIGGLQLGASSQPDTVDLPGSPSGTATLCAPEGAPAQSTPVGLPLRRLFDATFLSQPELDQQFLRQTAILDRVCASLAEAVTGLAAAGLDAQACLERLESDNVFLLPLDDHKQWFRYQPLFRGYLCQRLVASGTQSAISRMHARASAWYGSHELVEEAILHALAAGDEAAAVQLVDAHRHQAINRERWQRLERWLELLTPERVDARPELLTQRAWILHHRASLSGMSQCLDRAEGLIESAPVDAESRRSLCGEVSALRSAEYYRQGDPERTLAAARSALEAIPVERTGARGQAWTYLVLALATAGDLEAANDALLEGQREGPFYYSPPAPLLLVAAGLLQFMRADLWELSHTASQLIQVATERDLPESLAWGYHFQGCVCYDHDDLAAAETCFARALQLSDAGHGAVYLASGFGLAAALQARGEGSGAQAVVETLSAHAALVGDCGMILEVQGFQAHLALAQGRRGEAERWAVAHLHGLPSSPVLGVHDARLSLARILLALGTPSELREARTLLAALRDICEASHNRRGLAEVLALEAVLCDSQGDRAGADAALEQALATAEPGSMIRLFLDVGARMERILARHASSRPGTFVTKLLAAFPMQRSASVATAQAGLPERLSDRELEVLGLLAQRLSNKEIGEQLGISSQTVKRHTMNIYQKLLVQSRREAVARAIELGILVER